MDFNTFMVSVDEIVPGVWLGNEAASQSEEFIRKQGIRLVVNASKNIPSKFIGKIHYIRVPVDDPGIGGVRFGVKNRDVHIMRKSLRTVLNIIHRARRRGWPVLIHCHAGAQRSAIIAAAYLLDSGEVSTPDEAIKMVVQKRRIAFFGGYSVNFRDVLRDE